MDEDNLPFNSDHPNQPWSQKCVCGKVFMQPNSYGLHAGTCTKLKARLGKTLKEARRRRAGALDTNSEAESQPSSRKRKRNCAWLDEDNLDIDVVAETRPSVSTQSHSPSKADMGNGAQGPDDNDQGTLGLIYEASTSLALANPPSPELGRGHRDKKLSYKILPGNNFLPSSTLPASLFPQEAPVKPSGLSQGLEATGELPGELPSPLETPEEGVGSKGGPTSISTLKTEPNAFGLYKISRSESCDAPHDPDDSILPTDLREYAVCPAERVDPSHSSKTPRINLHPFPNISSFLLGEWYWSDESGKSKQSFQDLLDVIGSEHFKPSDVREANWDAINRQLAAESESFEMDVDSEEWKDDSGISWMNSSVTINVPLNKGMQNSGSHAFTVPGFHHRSLVAVIKDKLESSGGREYFHTLGHELRWKPGEGKQDVRVHGEMYSSSAFLEAYDDLQKSPAEPNCKLPRHVVGLMFASDSTMLATFGTAKLWPLYMFYANDTKYRRAKPSEKLFETVAYFEKLPDRFKDFFLQLSGRDAVPAPFLTHCQRELFHEQWKLLLDEDFIEAYCHGIVVKCYDGVERRFYPRIFTYSADYPEKILLASIKNLGTFPCPRCKIPMKDVPAMGQKRDRKNRVRLARRDDEARRKNISEVRGFIYKKKYSVTSEVVEARLWDGSMVPSENAFSHKLSSLGFDLFRMLVVDLMHEFDLGVWKAVFIQLLRILQELNKAGLSALDKRFRAMPTFGKDTIRRFVNNVSEMKQLAARDFEDLLQCAIPAFEGLLPSPHDKKVVALLYTLAEWQGLAKLRQHTDHTLDKLDALTTQLGDQLRVFVNDTCSSISTKELPREHQARKRRESRKKATGKASTTKRRKTSGQQSCSDDANDADNDSNSRKSKTLNLNTYKFHALGDVVSSIRMFGTTDSYSTQTPEGFHRYPKRHYKRTSKRNVSRQLSHIQTRQARIRKLWKQLLPEASEGYVDEDAAQLPYFIGRSQNNPVNLPIFIQKKRDDPAMKDFYSKLRKHLLPRVYHSLLQEAEQSKVPRDSQRFRLLSSLADGTSQDCLLESAEAQSDADQLYFHSERIYQHSLFHINYTSYDVRRETDIVNPATSRRDVMCLRALGSDESPATAHHLMYARVLGIYHVNVMYKGRGTSDFRKRRFDFLFVCWFEFCDKMPATKGLDRVRLRPLSEPGSVGFLDPADVLRASHIVRRYSLGPLHESAAGRILSKIAKDGDDWKEYLVNRFVDRDMLMRHYWGLGVGHLYSHGDSPDSLSENHTQGEDLEVAMAEVEGVVDSEEHSEQLFAREKDLGSDEPPDDDDDGASPEHTLDNLEEEELDVAGGESEDEQNSDLDDIPEADSDDDL